MESVSEIRKRSWKTRREKYGSRGHSGPYCACKPIYLAPWNARMRSMQDCLLRLWRHGIISEGQISKACGIDRVSCRELADEQKQREQSSCRHQWETHTDTELVAAGVYVESFKSCTKCGAVV
jgi:hypothetical protein